MKTLPEGVSLRPADRDDLDELVRIEKDAYRLQRPWTRKHFLSELGKDLSRTLVLTDDETDSLILGYIVYWVMEDDSQILNVVVDREYRGLGFAKKMIRQAIQECLKKGSQKILLDVRKSNAAAIQLYQSLYFRITSVRKNYYSDGEDAFFMELSLVGKNKVAQQLETLKQTPSGEGSGEIH